MEKEHIQYLHYMLKVGCLSYNKAYELFKIVQDEDEEHNEFKQFIVHINSQIREQSYQMMKTICEVTGEEKLILINTQLDEITKFQNTHTPVELEYFQTVVKETIMSEERKLPQIFCLNLASTLSQQFSRVNAEKVLDKWWKCGYLVMVDGGVYLGPRTMAEFGTTFQTQWEEYMKRCLCGEFVFYGLVCSSCNEVLHKHCVMKCLRTQNKCPQCKNVWVAREGFNLSQEEEEDGASDSSD